MNKSEDFNDVTVQPSELEPKRGLTRLWNAADIVLILFFFIILFVVGQVIALVAGTGMDKFIEAAGDPVATQEALNNADNFVLLIAGLVGSVVAGVGSILFVNAIRPKHTLSTLGFRWPERKWFRIAAIIALVLLLPRIALVYGLLELFPQWEESAAALEQAFEMDTTNQMIIVALVASIVVPIWEEVFFRGFIHNAIRNRLSVWPAIILSSLIFGLFHIIPVQIVGAFVLSVGLTWVYEKSDSLWPPIFAHALNNGLAFGIMALVDYFGAG